MNVWRGAGVARGGANGARGGRGAGRAGGVAGGGHRRTTIWQLAEAFGAICQADVDDATTHLVAAVVSGYPVSCAFIIGD